MVRFQHAPAAPAALNLTPPLHLLCVAAAAVPCPTGFTTNLRTQQTVPTSCIVPAGYYLKAPGQVCMQGFDFGTLVWHKPCTLKNYTP
jgi:hypothetical protein